MILLGAQGASSVTLAVDSLNPVGFDALNMSPACSAMVSPVSTPNPTLPAADRNRTQLVMRAKRGAARHHVRAHGLGPSGLISGGKRSVSHIVGCVVADAEPHAQTPRGSKCPSSGRQTHERDYHFVRRTGYSQRFDCHCSS